MAIAERIHQYVQRLPARFQAEALDFVEYLLAKAEHGAARQEEREWSNLSLAFAMREMEEEDPLMYTPSDLRVTFS